MAGGKGDGETFSEMGGRKNFPNTKTNTTQAACKRYALDPKSDGFVTTSPHLNTLEATLRAAV